MFGLHLKIYYSLSPYVLVLLYTLFSVILYCSRVKLYDLYILRQYHIFSLQIIVTKETKPQYFAILIA
jgi:hypothetical protein